MDEGTFDVLDRFLQSGDHAGGLDFLIAHFRDARQFHLFFEARLMKSRLELGLPLIQSEPTSEYPPDLRGPYNDAMVEAARETGALVLADGDIARAWPYFRAIGAPEPVAEAIGRLETGESPGESVEQIINIAFREGVHPVKGLELILSQHGMCQAITAFGMYQVEKRREECISLLVRNLHAEVVERIARTIEANEPSRPTGSITEMITGRDWLFGEYDTYVDTSHLLSLLAYSPEVQDAPTLERLHDLCAYGRKLSPMFQSQGRTPFENPFIDYDEYILAIMGIGVDERIAHFRKKVEDSDPQEVGTAAAQLLVNLLVRLGRYDEALQLSLEQLGEEDPSELACPSTLQLCNLAKDHARLKELARSRGDLLSYVAAT